MVCRQKRIDRYRSIESEERGRDTERAEGERDDRRGKEESKKRELLLYRELVVCDRFFKM